jgi:hypothetical protein
MLKTVSSVANALGALNYKGTWDASTNTPTLASGVGTQGDYYVVSVAGTTDLDGITNWGVGDWAAFNGSVWQRVEGGADGNFVNLDVTGGMTVDTDTLVVDDVNNRVGIGTDSPSQLLNLKGAAPFVKLESNSTSYNGFITNNDSGNFYFGIDDVSGGFYGSAYARAIYADGAYPVTFYTNALERLRILSTGGITFNGDTAQANALDDYEEGDWTPTLVGSITAGSYSVAVEDSSCKYTKVGRQVTVTGKFTFTVSSAGSGAAQIGGLPFATSATNAMTGTVRTKNIGLAAGTVSLCLLNLTSGSADYVGIGQSIDNSASVFLDIAGISSTDQISMTMTYFI